MALYSARTASRTASAVADAAVQKHLLAGASQGKESGGVWYMDALLREYLPILLFLGIAIAMAGAMVVASYIIARQRPNSEKASAYECGFEAFDDARSKFDVRFYLVSILFIIFDLEVAFLFPWAVSLGEIGLFGFWSMVVFLAILTIGFIYEWRKGALEWE
jgi:NADH-quinone oxidoreductase subunit A